MYSPIHAMQILVKNAFLDVKTSRIPLSDYTHIDALCKKPTLKDYSILLKMLSKNSFNEIL